MTGEANWTVLEIPGVSEVAVRAARKVARDYASLVEYDDMYQDALIHLATKSDLVHAYVDGPDGLGGLHHWLWCRLVNGINVSKSNRTRSLDALLAGGADE
ncbi:hypothetical protein [Micromonospora sp. NPDC048839]|uniref:hypothetical protein n=1 Tax=Micromonospora sp. NPDC048839 TaxID=3155641 RepID=UPI0033D778AE